LTVCVWRTICAGEPSPHTEIVNNITSYPSEKYNFAAANPDKVPALKKRANELAATMEEPLLLRAKIGAMPGRLHLPSALPAEEASFNEEN